MKKLLEAANQFIAESDWKTISVLKVCLLSLGIIIGMMLPQSAKGIVFSVCGVLFLLTYMPLMTKLLRILFRR